MPEIFTAMGAVEVDIDWIDSDTTPADAKVILQKLLQELSELLSKNPDLAPAGASVTFTAAELRRCSWQTEEDNGDFMGLEPNVELGFENFEELAEQLGEGA